MGMFKPKAPATLWIINRSIRRFVIGADAKFGAAI
jgi:hypothetical protein